MPCFYADPALSATPGSRASCRDKCHHRMYVAASLPVSLIGRADLAMLVAAGRGLPVILIGVAGSPSEYSPCPKKISITTGVLSSCSI